MSSRGFDYLPEDYYFPFPPVENSTPEGIVASGGNLSPGMLLSAYKQGIFPWYSDPEPILWWSPDPRFVLLPGKLHISSSMKKVLKQEKFRITWDSSFREVITRCSEVPRKDQPGTWITFDMIEAYCELHRLGYAHSVEVRIDDDIVGGLYGISLGKAFFGESMFSLVSNSSKAAFIHLALILFEEGFHFIDSQVYTQHLETLGCMTIIRRRYLEMLEQALKHENMKGEWGGRFSNISTSAAVSLSM